MKCIEYKSKKIAYHTWEASTTKALIFIIHGMGEHGRRYEHVAKFFNQYNYTVCALDHYGHGLSEGKKGDIESMEYIYGYMDMFFKEMYTKFGQKPTILYGHSMGGSVVANYLIEHNQKFKAAIITSPWLTLPKEPNIIQMTLAKIMMKIYPSFQDHTKLDARLISRDKVEVDKYVNDPLVHDCMTPRFYFEFKDAGALAIDYADRIKIPVLLMHGMNDGVTAKEGSAMMYEENPEFITFKTWDDASHELHNDICKAEVLDYMIDWVAGRI